MTTEPWDLPLRALHRIDRHTLLRWQDHTRARAIERDGRRNWSQTAIWLAASILAVVMGWSPGWFCPISVTILTVGVITSIRSAIRCHHAARAAEREAEELLAATPCGEAHPEGRGACVREVTHTWPHENARGGTW